MRLSQEARAVRNRLYNKGFTDRQMADILLVAKSTIQMWRKKNGKLKPNKIENKELMLDEFISKYEYAAKYKEQIIDWLKELQQLRKMM